MMHKTALLSQRAALAGLLLALLPLGLLPACTPAAPALAQTADLRVVASTSIVADVVRQIGGEHVQVTSLVPIGVDEHAYEPAPRDVVQAAQADLLFINGAGLETFIERLATSAGDQVKPISVSEGITLLKAAEHEEEDHGGDDHEGGDPHVWTDPNNVLIWVDNIERALVQADPDHAADYQQRAAAYRQTLRELDAWVRQQVEQVPQPRRLLVTDHLVFTYFADRYGFEQVGAVIEGYSTLSTPSARQLALLEDHIRELNVPTLFVGSTVSSNLTQRVAQDLGVRTVTVITGSLTRADGPAPTYVDYIRYNVSAITGALK